jgi:protein-S-isoprenylcysteine O-methyltransferase Ste14
VNGNTLYQWLLVAWFALAGATFILLFFVAAPYGRHARRGWGPTLSDKAGWVVMEAPSPLVFLACYLLGRPGTVTSLIFLAMWLFHYIYRAFIYPLRRRDSDRRMPLVVVGMGICFNLVNAGLNGWYLFGLSGGYPSAWLVDPRFLAGLALFVAGLLINRQADSILRKLRAADGPRAADGQREYEVPEGGFYRWISCPNYFGEIVQWTGWAIATWSLPGLSFAVWTVANLAPRARANHRWYLDTLPDYPPERKALIPGLW